MCTTCINHVNESKKFRKKAEQTHKELLKRLENIQFSEIKVEPLNVEREPATINVYDDLDFKDDDDDITLDNFQQSCSEKELPLTTNDQVCIKFLRKFIN